MISPQVLQPLWSDPLRHVCVQACSPQPSHGWPISPAPGSSAIACCYGFGCPQAQAWPAATGSALSYVTDECQRHAGCMEAWDCLCTACYCSMLGALQRFLACDHLTQGLTQTSACLACMAFSTAGCSQGDWARAHTACCTSVWPCLYSQQLRHTCPEHAAGQCTLAGCYGPGSP